MMNINILRFDTIDSTNTEALKQAKAGAKEGLCVVARQQTAGRGRYGRNWVSTADAGLYFSIVLRPKLETQYLPLITLMAGVAVHDVLAQLGLSPDIKWVNDVLVNDKKICGILAETTDTPDGLAVVLGIGINLSSSGFPPEIADIATSLEAAEARPIAAPDLIQMLTGNLENFYRLLSEQEGPARMVEEWRKRSTYYSGRRVSVSIGDEIVIGTTDGLEPNGALRLRQDDGRITVVQAGVVQRIRSAD